LAEEAKANHGYLERQTQLLEREKERHLEQNSMDRELWRKEKAEAATQLSQLASQTQQLLREKEIMLVEVTETKEKLRNIAEMFEKAQQDSAAELKRLRTQNAALDKQLQSLKKRHDGDLESLKAVLYDMLTLGIAHLQCRTRSGQTETPRRNRPDESLHIRSQAHHRPAEERPRAPSFPTPSDVAWRGKSRRQGARRGTECELAQHDATRNFRKRGRVEGAGDEGRPSSR
jgi:hypothetical protein